MKRSDHNSKHEERPAHSAKIDRDARRRLKAQREKNKNIWYGMGMFGLVGWSIAIPTLLGITLGIWIDRHWPSPYSWTLMLLFAGLMVGCINSWHWIKQTGKDDERG
ncbi:MAG: AtpZ/AtpI family protein [Desulfobulbus sp.]